MRTVGLKVPQPAPKRKGQKATGEKPAPSANEKCTEAPEPPAGEAAMPEPTGAADQPAEPATQPEKPAERTTVDKTAPKRKGQKAGGDAA